MNLNQYCKKIEKAIKDEEKGTAEYRNFQMEAPNRFASVLFYRLSNDEARHGMQLKHLHAKICK